LRFAVEARADMVSIADYLRAEAGPRAAARYLRDLHQRLSRLRERPKVGVLVPDYGAGVRFVPCRRHVIYYEVEKKHVVVLRVLHGAQDRDAIMRRKTGDQP
jgi:toxin ParE1/3/4